MAYVFELNSSQAVYLENQGTQTVVTTISQIPGQQQQASSGVHTGLWTTPPSVYRTAKGVILQVQAEQGEYYIQVEGTAMSVLGRQLSLDPSQQIQLQQVSNSPLSSLKPMKPMKPIKIEPMKPMQMGNMQMNLNPMEMRMGSTPSNIRQFCSQCGAKVKPDDRFCSSCGHHLD